MTAPSCLTDTSNLFSFYCSVTQVNEPLCFVIGCVLLRVVSSSEKLIYSFLKNWCNLIRRVHNTLSRAVLHSSMYPINFSFSFSLIISNTDKCKCTMQKYTYKYVSMAWLNLCYEEKNTIWGNDDYNYIYTCIKFCIIHLPHTYLYTIVNIILISY